MLVLPNVTILKHTFANQLTTEQVVSTWCILAEERSLVAHLA
jgi:hypothetical protein